MNILLSHRFWSLFCPFISTYLITLNVYNGDIFKIPENLEYMTWYIIPLLINSTIDIKNKNNIKIYILDYNLYILGIISNLYWYHSSPFRIDRDIRHRTEYYDTQCLLCALNYYTLVERCKEIVAIDI